MIVADHMGLLRANRINYVAASDTTFDLRKPWVKISDRIVVSVSRLFV